MALESAAVTELNWVQFSCYAAVPLSQALNCLSFCLFMALIGRNLLNCQLQEAIVQHLSCAQQTPACGCAVLEVDTCKKTSGCTERKENTENCITTCQKCHFVTSILKYSSP